MCSSRASFLHACCLLRITYYSLRTLLVGLSEHQAASNKQYALKTKLPSITGAKGRYSAVPPCLPTERSSTGRLGRCNGLSRRRLEAHRRFCDKQFTCGACPGRGGRRVRPLAMQGIAGILRIPCRACTLPSRLACRERTTPAKAGYLVVSGPSGIRTHGLLNAIETRSQLRYGPMQSLRLHLRDCRAIATSMGDPVDLEGFEPSASSVRLMRAPNCATGPCNWPFCIRSVYRWRTANFLTISRRTPHLIAAYWLIAMLLELRDCT